MSASERGLTEGVCWARDKKDEVIAYTKNGYSTGNHIHFEVRLNGTPQEPDLYLYEDHVFMKLLPMQFHWCIMKRSL